MLDRLIFVSQKKRQATEVRVGAGRRYAVVELLVQILGALGVASRQTQWPWRCAMRATPGSRGSRWRGGHRSWASSRARSRPREPDVVPLQPVTSRAPPRMSLAAVARNPDRSASASASSNSATAVRRSTRLYRQTPMRKRARPPGRRPRTPASAMSRLLQQLRARGVYRAFCWSAKASPDRDRQLQGRHARRVDAGPVSRKTPGWPRRTGATRTALPREPAGLRPWCAPRSRIPWRGMPRRREAPCQPGNRRLGGPVLRARSG